MVNGAKKCYDMDMLNNLRLIVNCLVEESPNQYTTLCAQHSVLPWIGLKAHSHHPATLKDLEFSWFLTLMDQWPGSLDVAFGGCGKSFARWLDKEQ